MKAKGKKCPCGMGLIRDDGHCCSCGGKVVAESDLGLTMEYKTWFSPTPFVIGPAAFAMFHNSMDQQRPNIDFRFADGTVDKQPETKILTKSEPKKPRTKWTTIPDGWTGHHSDSELYFVDDLEIGDEITETTIEDILE